MPDGVMIRPALGQSSSLGSLYNARADKTWSENLFRETPEENITINTAEPSTEWTFTQTNSLKEKFDALGLSAELGASFLASLFVAKGSGGWLSLAKTSSRMTEASAIYTIATRKEALDMCQEGLREYVDPDALQNEEATHVISGIQWGARTVITARGKDSGAWDAATAQQVLQSFGDMDAGNVDAVKELAKSFEFKLNSDIPGKASSQSYDYEGVSRFLMNIPGAVQKSKGGKGFHLAYELVPIAHAAKQLSMDNDDVKWAVFQPVGEGLLGQIRALFERLGRATQDLSDYCADVKSHPFCVTKEHMEEADNQAKKLKGLARTMKSKLADPLVGVRSQDLDESHIKTFLEDYEWKLSPKREPLSVIGNYVAKMAFADAVKGTSNGKVQYICDENTATVSEMIMSAAKTSHDLYVFYFDVAGIAHPMWAANHAKATELVKTPDCAIIVIDCDMVSSHCQLDKPRIEQFRGGVSVVPDLVAEIQALADKSLLRCARPEKLLEITDRDPAQDKQRPVKTPCPGPNCAANGEYQWICPECKELVLAGHTNDYLYCRCGKYEYPDGVFKCKSPTHGAEFMSYANKAELRGFLDGLAPFEEFNILILGETGVGKSTFINAFINYLLYDTLADAQKVPELDYAIPCSFSYDQVEDGYATKRVTVTVGEETDLEKRAEQGTSATQKTVTYSLRMNGKIIRLIDTPGIGDTRGLSKDYENVKDILDTLESINRLSTILFLMKPNSARLTTTFDFCLTELLTRLHKDTSKNIVFGFTNARSTNYLLGDTREPLEALLAKRNTGITKLDRQNVFFFDSESFRFLAAYKQHNTEMPDKPIYEASWEKSKEEARRLVVTTLKLPQHEVRKTLQLNRTRSMILNMTKPMVTQTEAINNTKLLIDGLIKQISKLTSEGKTWEGELQLKQVVPKRYDFHKPRTVCTHADCFDTKYDPRTKQTVVVYKTVCHLDCRISVPDEQIGLPELSKCWAFHLQGTPCRNRSCKHEWRLHLHITHEFKMETEVIKNSEAVQKLLANNDKKAAVEQQRKDAEAKLIRLDQEETEIKKALATFGVYLDRSAIVVYNDATIGYLGQMIKQAEASHNDEDAQRYRDQIEAYKVQCAEIKRAIANKSTEAPTEDTITEVINRLTGLESVGPILRKNIGLGTDPSGRVALRPTHRSRPVRLKPSGITYYEWMYDKAASAATWFLRAF